MMLYRARYEWQDGRTSYFTFASVPADALRYAADCVRAWTRGYLLELHEERPIVQQFRLMP